MTRRGTTNKVMTNLGTTEVVTTKRDTTNKVMTN